MSEAALALLPKGGEGKPPTNTLAVSRGQEPAVLGLMQMMNSCVSTMLSAQNTALQASEARQTAALTTAVGDLKVHTEAKIAAETASIRQAFSIDEEAAKAHAAKLQGLREEELSAAEAARTRAVSHATATEAAEKVREERLAAEEVAADRAARVHAGHAQGRSRPRAAAGAASGALGRRRGRDHDQRLGSPQGGGGC